MSSIIISSSVLVRFNLDFTVRSHHKSDMIFNHMLRWRSKAKESTQNEVMTLILNEMQQFCEEPEAQHEYDNRSSRSMHNAKGHNYNHTLCGKHTWIHNLRLYNDYPVCYKQTLLNRKLYN